MINTQNRGNNSQGHIPLGEDLEEYDFPIVIGQKGFVCQVGRKIGEGSYGIVHEAKIIRSLNNIDIEEKRIVIKFVDCSQDHNTFVDFEKEFQAMLNVEHQKVKGFCRLVDSGTCKENLIRGLVSE